jgi:hypothetical protein
MFTACIDDAVAAAEAELQSVLTKKVIHLLIE